MHDCIILTIPYYSDSPTKATERQFVVARLLMGIYKKILSLSNK